MRYPFLLYGSYGYTGALIAELAAQRGLRPLLAGRDAQRLRQQAESLGLEYRVFVLEDQAALDAALHDTGLILHIAGPYHRTSPGVAQACLRTHSHYLDITGELVVFEHLAALGTSARQAGVMLLPGVGFDVVPTDCLALQLKQQMPQAVRLTLGVFNLGGGVSHGTALTVVENLARGGAVRIDGQLVGTPYAARTRQVDFGRGPVTLALSPLGDLTTAYHSTGIPNIETYMAFRPRLVRAIRWMRPWLRLTGWAPLQALLRRAILARPAGPTPQARQTGRSLAWAEVVDAHGQAIEACLETPEAYQLTAQTALRAVERILEGEVQPGYQTPAGHFGADFIFEFDGVVRR